jgi:hypothetical protein
LADRERDRRTGQERGRKTSGASREERGRKKAVPVTSDHLPLDRENLILFAVALAVIVVGYLFLARGSITLAPILLVLGYCVLVPVAIIFRPRRRREPEGPVRGKVGGE